MAYPHIAQVIALLERYFTIIDAVRCAMLIREEGNLDPIGEETVPLKRSTHRLAAVGLSDAMYRLMDSRSCLAVSVQ